MLQGLEHGRVAEPAPGGIDGALRAYDAIQVLHRARQGRNYAWKLISVSTLERQ